MALRPPLYQQTKRWSARRLRNRGMPPGFRCFFLNVLRRLFAAHHSVFSTRSVEDNTKSVMAASHEQHSRACLTVYPLTA